MSGLVEVVAAAVSVQPPDGAGQDRSCAFRTLDGGAGVVVCDGVGSHARSGEAADAALESAWRHLTRGFEAVRTVTDVVAGDLAASAPGGATTLLSVVASGTGDVGYVAVGNGSILEIRAVPGGPGAVVWTDHVLPHIDRSVGCDALRSHLPYPGLPERSVGQLVLHPGWPVVLVACSDGVATGEERRFGRFGDGSTWQAVPAPLAALLGAVGGAWERWTGKADAEDLHADVDELLDELVGASALEDDATIAVVVVRPGSGG